MQARIAVIVLGQVEKYHLNVISVVLTLLQCGEQFIQFFLNNILKFKLKNIYIFDASFQLIHATLTDFTLP